MPDTAEANTWTIESTGLIHAPGFMGWIKNVYRGDKAEAYKLLGTALPGIPLGLATLYFEGKIEPELDGDTVTLAYPGDEEAGKLLADLGSGRGAWSSAWEED